MAQFRKAVFYLFVALYVTICPAMVLYSLGYVWAPGARKGIVRTGVMYVSSAPPGASVYLGKRHYTKRTPTLLRSLLPGNYELSVVLKGHRPWTRTVTVEAQKATTLEHLLLLPEPLQPRRLLDELFDALIAVPGGHQVLLLGRGGAHRALVYDWKAERAWPVLPDDAALGKGTVSLFAGVKESASVVLRVGPQDPQQLVWLELKGKETRIEDLTAWLPERVRAISWDPAAKHELMVFHDGAISRLDLSERSFTPRILEDVRGFGVFRKRVYALAEDNVVVRTDLHGRDAEPILELPGLTHALATIQGAVQMSILSDDRIVFLGEQGELVTSWFPYYSVDRGVVGMEYDPQRERLLIWDRKRIGVLEVPREAFGARIAPAASGVRWIETGGRHLDQAVWAYGGSHAVWRDGERVGLLEVDGERKLQVDQLLTAKPGSAFAYSDETGTVYALEHDRGTFLALEIVPKQDLLTLPFPERTEEPTPKDMRHP